jgi:DNA-binding NtrC family response regulator
MAGKARLIVVDDERPILEMLSEFFQGQGYEVDTFEDSRKALVALRGNQYEILITDLAIPSIDGLHLLKYVQKEFINTICIVITGHGSLDSAIEAIQYGVFEYLQKPFPLEKILETVDRAVHYHSLIQNDTVRGELMQRASLLNRFSSCQVARQHGASDPSGEKAPKYGSIIGVSLAMQKVYALVDNVAESAATVLITGESGVGKELVAKAIHYNSLQKDGPFVTVNCGAIPDALLESELFGYEKGAFTGAASSKMGKFECADKGSIFLDEIGDMSFNLQVKLLRVIQERTLERLGGTKTTKIETRIIAATNRDLEGLVAEGKFREDLYYRLNVIPVRIPPLRDRRGDIPLLLNYFVEKANGEYNTTIEGFTADAMTGLMSYDFPGNIRELQNLVQRLAIMRRSGRIELADLPERFLAVKNSGPVGTFSFDEEAKNSESVSATEKNLLQKPE